jgi:hypothetical protein
VHGLVNKAIERLAHRLGGSGAWDAIRLRAGIDTPVFVGIEPYADELTSRLFDAASEVLDIPVDELLDVFGEYWIEYAGESAYGPLLALAGRDFRECVEHLDELHARARLIMPQLRPPSFRCTDVAIADADGSGSLRLHYYSERERLAPMVVGLLRGLGRRFQTDVEVTHVAARAGGADHDVFDVRFAPA